LRFKPARLSFETLMTAEEILLEAEMAMEKSVD
jgi:hypothetical protein